MKVYQKKYFELVRAALWQTEVVCDLTREELERIMHVALVQQTETLVLDYILEHTSKEWQYEMRYLLFPYLGKLEEAKKSNMKINSHVASFAKMLRAHDVSFVCMKGATIAPCYAKPMLRHTGDIDYVCAPDSYQRAVEVIEKRAKVELKNGRSARHDKYGINGVTYEQHSIFAEFVSRKHHDCWHKEAWKDVSDPSYVAVNEVDVPVLSPTLNAAFIFVHMFFDLTTKGMRVRHLCDWAMWLHHYKGRIDVHRLNDLLHGIGLYTAYCTLGTMLVDDLGLPESEFPLPLIRNGRTKRIVKRVMGDFFNVGKYGHGSAYSKEGMCLWRFHNWVLTIWQDLKYMSIAPMEAGLRVPDMMWWSFISRFKRGKHRFMK